MTELIVALDGPGSTSLACLLNQEAGVNWFKIGPQGLLNRAWQDWFGYRSLGADMRLFLDLKLADTADTCREACKRFTDAGIAAVSTFTDRATAAAMRGADGSNLRVWRVLRLTDSYESIPPLIVLGHGVICSVEDLRCHPWLPPDRDRVCPGIRLTEPRGGHIHTASPREAVEAGATHVVVGRPIWQAADPRAATRNFLEELRP